MQTDGSDTKKQIMAALAVLVVIALIVGGAAFANKNSSIKEPLSAQLTNSSTTATTASAASNANYKDGTYTAQGGYNTPGGRNSINLKITIQNGVVTNTSASTNPPDQESEFYDQMFISAYKGRVEGKSISQLSLSRIAGASLTTEGFNNALQQIANQAKA